MYIIFYLILHTCTYVSHKHVRKYTKCTFKAMFVKFWYMF